MSVDHEACATQISSVDQTINDTQLRFVDHPPGAAQTTPVDQTINDFQRRTVDHPTHDSQLRIVDHAMSAAHSHAVDHSEGVAQYQTVDHGDDATHKDGVDHSGDDAQSQLVDPLPIDAQAFHVDPTDHEAHNQLVDHQFSAAQTTDVVDHSRPDTQPSVVGSHHRAGNQEWSAADALILIAADVLDDLERTRIATENRLRSLTHEPVEGERGGWFGKGLDPEMLEVQRVGAILDGLKRLEREAERDLVRAMKAHPLGPWVKRTTGVGEKQAARLLAAIGDPNTRRTVSQLWAYCGYHVLPAIAPTTAQATLAGHTTTDADTQRAPTGDQVENDIHENLVVGDPRSSVADQSPDDDQSRSVGGQRDRGIQAASVNDHRISETQLRSVGVAPKRRRGVKSNWSTNAKTRAYLVAESCIKQRSSPYRSVYDAGRKKYADAVHQHPCERCGPSGKPAQVGSPLSLGHQHARAMRLVAKAILRDIWIEAHRLTDDDNLSAQLANR